MRRALVTIHLWLGLTLGLFWAVQGLSGAFLVFHRELDRLAMPPVVGGSMASLDLLDARASAALGAPAIRVGIADGRRDLLFTDSADGQRVLLAASDGRIVRNDPIDPATPFGPGAARWVYALHEELLAGETGHRIVGFSGLVLLTAALMGVWIGWPRRGSWRAAFALRSWRTVRQRLYGWHRAIGLPLGLALTVSTLTGAWMVFSPSLRPALMSLTGVPAFVPSSTVAADRRITPQEAFDLALKRFPTAGFVRVTSPSPNAPVYVIRLHQPDEWRAWSGTTSITIDPAAGRILDAYDPLTAPFALRLADAAFSLHNGEIAGLGGRIAIMLAGLALPVLYVTGILAWWRKRRASRRQPTIAATAPAF